MADETSTAYVIAMGDIPLAVAASLDAAQADALARATQYLSPGNLPEYRWEAYRDAVTWRLQSRGKGSRRFAWTGYVVFEVPVVGEVTC